MLWWQLRRLRSGNHSVRDAAARQLGELRDDRAIPALIECLARLGDYAGRDVEQALRRIRPDWPKSDGARQALPRLVALAGAEDWGTREQVAKLLGRIGDEAVVNPLARLVQDRDDKVSRAAASCLLTLKLPLANEMLLRHVGKGSPLRRAMVRLSILLQTEHLLQDALSNNSRGISADMVREHGPHLRQDELRAISEMEDYKSREYVELSEGDPPDTYFDESPYRPTRSPRVGYHEEITVSREDVRQAAREHLQHGRWQ